MLEGFRFVQKFRVAFRDIDMMQHVNHTAFIRWAEAQRADYFIENLGETVNGERGMILVRIDFAYEKQIVLRENVVMGARVSRVGTRSFDFTYEIWSADREHRCAIGTTTLVAYDYTAGASIPVPEAWRAALRVYEPALPEGL